MNLIDWSDDLSLEIEEIDAQHKDLVTMINRLHKATMGSDWSKQIVTLTDILLGLIDYLRYHFATEEKYMIEYQYPEYEVHRNEHLKFVNEVTSFSQAFRNGTQGLEEEVLTFLKEWYIRHITLTDTKFGVFLHSRDID